MRRACVVAIAVLGLTCLVGQASVASAQGKNDSPRIVPPWGNAHGHAATEWSEEWIKWVLTIKAGSNPLMDTTGVNCAEGQSPSGNLWFLAGIGFSSEVEVTRDCTVPPGKFLYFPIVNSWWLQFPTDPPFVEADVKWILANCLKAVEEPPDSGNWVCAGGMDAPGPMSLAIDGIEVLGTSDLMNHRVFSDIFMLNLPHENVYNPWGLFAGRYGPNIGDGYYVMLEPLSPGIHYLHFTAPDWGQDVTYVLNVEPPKKK